MATLSIFDPNEAFFRDHVTFTSVDAINHLTQPLKNLGISYFTFDRTYQDRSHIRLTNAGKWIETYYKEKLYDVAIFEKNPKIFCDGFVFWSFLNQEPVYTAARQHNISQGLTITQPHTNYCDFFHFGTNCDYYLPEEFLIQNINFLYQFIALFKQKARDLIAQAEKERFILPVTNLDHIHMSSLARQNSTPSTPRNIHCLTRLYLGKEYNNVYLTRKELQILFFMRRGKNMNEIAILFNLSPRTLETHIKHVKEKLKCDTLFELGFVSAKLGVDHVYPFDVDALELKN